MLLIQMTGLSGAGKTTISYAVKELLLQEGYRVEVIDGDVYRRMLCRDLQFSKEDRCENIRRLGFVGNLLARNGVIAIMATINPYEEVRREIEQYGMHVKTIWIQCSIDTVVARDPKGLYKRSMLDDSDPQKVFNMTGITDPYEAPDNPSLIINTEKDNEAVAAEQLFNFICSEILEQKQKRIV